MYKQIFASSLVAIALIAISVAVVPATSSVRVALAEEGFCGDGIVNQSSEECDGGSGCTSGCAFAFCGDGVVNQAAEQCDGSSGITSGFKCTSGCILTPVSEAPFCGDGVVNQSAEECDGGSDCTSGCIKASGGGGSSGGGGGGGGSTSSYPRLSIAQNGAVPQVRAGSNTVGSLSIRNYGSITAPNVDISFLSLPAGFSYNGKNAVISTSTVWILEGNDFVSQKGSVISYPRLWHIGNRLGGDIAVMNIPLTVASSVKPGTYEISVNAHIGTTMSIIKNVEAKLKITVVAGTPTVTKTPTKPVVKTPTKQVAAVVKAKPITVKPKATTTVCIPSDEYAALMAASTTSAVTTPDNALTALGHMFDLGTGSPCFGLTVLLLIILAVIIAIRLIFHYMDAESDNETPRNQMPLIK